LRKKLRILFTFLGRHQIEGEIRQEDFKEGKLMKGKLKLKSKSMRV